MAVKYTTWLPVLALLLVLYARPTHAFGAGNIGSTSKIEGSNWRHGDIEDTLLTLLTARAMGGKKFSKLDVKRTYFGNWLRDYSQAIDVGTVKYVSAEVIRLLLWILGFMSFGYGTGEFEVTAQRLGCYRPEEHIDNPKDYADNLDARQYDRRLRGPVDERRELSIDERNGMKAYIATEDRDITTSAGMIRNLFRKSIELGRRYKQTRDERDFYEALRLLGTGCHCLEDFSAHSNYTELALIELGERDIFPHVGQNTQMRLQGARSSVYPLVTGTFGGVDFLHSVMGEFTDKAAQSELQELEGTIQQSQNADTSLLKDLLDKLPPGILGDSDHKGKADQLQANAQAAQMQNMHISPKEPEEFTAQIGEISKQIYPILEFHDNIMKSISEAIDKIPVLPDLIEELQNQVSLFVFSLLAPFIVPVISQVKNELRTGSSEIIQSSRDKQMVVFNDDRSTDPTHSMLSKDHFTNVLNEPAGKVGCAVLRWVVPQIVAAWDDERIDIRRTNDRIIHGVMHHPAQREYGDDGARDGRMAMFRVVEQWWGEMDDRVRDVLRDKLSRDGIENFRNHKEGVEDSGHGCCKPLGMPTVKTSQSSGAIGGVMVGLSQALGGGSGGGQGSHVSNQISGTVGDAVGGGALGSIVGGLAGAVGGGLLGGAFGGDKTEKKTYESSEYRQDGSYNTRLTETGHRPGGYEQEERYGQAQMSQTQYSSGGHREDYQRYEQDGQQGRTGYGFEQSHEVRTSHGGGYEQRTEQRYEHPGGRYEGEYQEQGVTSSGRQYGHQESYSGHHGKKDDSDDDDDSGDDDDWEKKEKKRRKKEEKRLKKLREEEEERHGRRSGSHGRKKSKSRSRERRHDEDYGRSSGGYGGGYQSSQRRDENESRGSYGQQEYGRSESRYEQSSHSESRYERSSGYGGGRDEYQQQQSYSGDSYGGGGYNQRSEYGSSGYGGYGGGSGYGSSGYGEQQGGYEQRRW
ncbi:hypothetical protein M409DRAFT_65085 [Zasmidium cellare ATCC 36951]|uniref:Het-C-domain-containing protein n=1 Tax=Zasmidium cellare ATCC 36951 TaxID=1080233 RepID=A0A6A6CUB7_ZASCE|nr:uncharacterized protein M409DRAFT_65085 [Zasmidium cellare ATCC 36951]KAF2169412.1 hypothetical protein M409DRAFT_65085 [Zasmidium cellare ATCC 36951]